MNLVLWKKTVEGSFHALGLTLFSKHDGRQGEYLKRLRTVGLKRFAVNEENIGSP